MTTELLTTSDVAPILDVSPRRVLALASSRADFPKPYATTPAGLRLWRRADVEQWAASADRSRGRPRFTVNDR